MVHIVALRGPDDAVDDAVDRIREGANGYFELADRVWIVGGELDVAEWRNQLAGSGADVTVAQLSGAWASVGYVNLSNWLKGMRRGF